jgi:hypothetical protein
MVAKKRKPTGKLIAYGLGSCALYSSVYYFQDLIMEHFAKGGLYTVLPIATVFLFSWIHGTFAGTLWQVLGIEAVKKNPLQATLQAPSRTDARTRAAA